MNKPLLVLVTASWTLLAGAAAAQPQLPAGIPPELAAKAQAAMQSGGGGAPAPAPAPAPTSSATAAPVPDSTANQSTLPAVPVFGQWLFQGKFAQQSFTGFNPDYLINVGDQIDVRLWGAIDIQQTVKVDTQGNIFLPKVGPIRVLNVRNGDLNDRIRERVSGIYRENISVYSTLSAAQPVRVFVGGNVRNPGLYGAFASDSLLHFLDLAGGIDPASGSYLDIRFMRNNQVTQRVNLYQFLLNGQMPPTQFHDGDTIFVGPIQKTIQVSGLVSRPVQFEFDGPLTYAALLEMAGLSAKATHVQVTHNEGRTRQVEYLPIDALKSQPVRDGDSVQVLADRLIGEIIVTVQGEYRGPSQFVLPYKATLKDLLAQIEFTDQSRRDSVQIFRKSVAMRQKQMLEESLLKLQQSALTARSNTSNEAALRTQEANLMMQFIDRARTVQPKGQLVLGADVDAGKIALEDGDLLHIPRKQELVAVQGEVYLPNAFVFARGDSLQDYVEKAGGYTVSADDDRILLLKPSGEVHICDGDSTPFGVDIEPGDEILVFPKVDSKNFEFAKDVIAILYQIAVAAGVAVRL